MQKYNEFAFLALCLGLILAGGCELVDPDSTPRVAPEEEVTEESSVAATSVDGEVGEGWRDGRTVGTIQASNNAVEWETLNIEAPPGPNLPGDSEWIIARIEGQGYTRLLIMTMDTSGGRRDPSRILLDGPGGGFQDGRFNVPLPGIARWRVEYSSGALRIILNGREIWSAAGNYTVERAIMTDSGRRGFIGQWRPVQ